MTTNNKATLHFSDGTEDIDLPIYNATLGPDVIDIGRLFNQSGKFAYDPGFMSTASCKSKVSYIDGDQGKLLYRGYPIEQLAVNCSFLETVYLLLNGQLPSINQIHFDEYQKFKELILANADVGNLIPLSLQAYSKQAHPMSMLMGLVSAMAGLYKDWNETSNVELDSKRQELCKMLAINLIAKIPTIVAMIYRYTIGHQVIDLNNQSNNQENNLSYTANFMRMMFASSSKNYKTNEVLVRALDRIFVLHADHEQNASTSTVRLAGSSNTHPYAAITAAIACLWGQAHGGANEACLRMLDNLAQDGAGKLGQFIAQVKDKNSKVRLMGFGHRVYKNYDPRAKLMRETCHEVLQELGLEQDHLFSIALKLEKIALEDEYFISRKLYPNVDFYSGIVQKALGIPTSMFTCIFALARTAGWLTQWLEMTLDPESKIGRPRQLYLGNAERVIISPLK